MSNLELALSYLACPDDKGSLNSTNNHLICQSCKREFRILNCNTIELLPKHPFHPNLEKSRKGYTKWYSKLLEGNQYSIEKNDKKSTSLPIEFDNDLVSKIQLSKNEFVCEVGSGRRNLSLKYAKNSKFVFHTDLDIEDIEKARVEAKRNNLDNILFVMCNYFHLPFKPASLPYVINTGVLGRHGNEHDEKLLEQICNVTKKGGNIIIDFNAKERKIISTAVDGSLKFNVLKKEIISLILKFNLKIEKIYGLGYLPMIRNYSPLSYKIGNTICKYFLPPSRWLVITKN